MRQINSSKSYAEHTFFRGLAEVAEAGTFLSFLNCDNALKHKGRVHTLSRRIVRVLGCSVAIINTS